MTLNLKKTFLICAIITGFLTAQSSNGFAHGDHSTHSHDDKKTTLDSMSDQTKKPAPKKQKPRKNYYTPPQKSTDTNKSYIYRKPRKSQAPKSLWNQ